MADEHWVETNIAVKEAIEDVAEATEDIVAMATEWDTCLHLCLNAWRFVLLFHFL